MNEIKIEAITQAACRLVYSLDQLLVGELEDWDENNTGFRMDYKNLTGGKIWASVHPNRWPHDSRIVAKFAQSGKRGTAWQAYEGQVVANFVLVEPDDQPFDLHFEVRRVSRGGLLQIFPTDQHSPSADFVNKIIQRRRLDKL
ncbi:MAG: hypothetical protein HY454_01080 [Parcubacteria group bacterium]|nr:hypothetical protein [Parcubacteria group bacterium]